MYEYTDKVIKKLNKLFIREFTSFRYDELNILLDAKLMYHRMYKAVCREFLKIAQNKYPDADDTLIIMILTDYDPVVKYVFEHEVERKQSRFAEGCVAGADYKTSLRLWAAMIAQFAITVTDRAHVEYLKSKGVKRVRWVTTPDERLCAVCAAMDGNVYDIDKIPPKPHIGCRCYVVAEKP